MSVVSKRSDDGSKVTIVIDGRFDFSLHREFRDAYESQGSNIKAYDIDMSETLYLDSSALGMLLLLRDFASTNEASISINNCSDEVKKIFELSNFEQLFDFK